MTSQHFQNTLTFECVAVTEIKSNQKMPFREDLRKWHKIMREHVLRTGLNDPYDHKLGRCKPNQCFNVDQTSMLVIINTERAYKEIQKNHQEKIWISQPECALDRRQCTVQILAQAEGRTVIFSVTGKSIR